MEALDIQMKAIREIEGRPEASVLAKERRQELKDFCKKWNMRDFMKNKEKANPI